MSDASFQLLLPYLENTHNHTLWIADENVLHSGQAVTPHEDLDVITNRYDVYRQCLKQSLQTRFSDYDLSYLPDNSVDTVVYRVSKEKPVVHHIINEAFRTLKAGGNLVISGEKSDGTKSYIEKAGKLFGQKIPARKSGNSYLGVILKTSRNDVPQRLDDKEYPRIREIHTSLETPTLSKPGLFGWDKEDQGSRLLMDTASHYFQNHTPPQSILDLGCGYGYLTLRSASWPQVKYRCATDNNAAAIACATENFNRAQMAVVVIADDCASGINEKFDCILCNPPFHQGFSVDSSLTDKFLRNSSERLSSQGIALFVVNQFIGLEKKAKGYFSRVETLTRDQQFKVIALTR
ncbi:class I SAM-dependent methyltransferase [Aestuariicella hydrocarbonica]|uniref:Class I SAM-dependent methyltransferase n=1 Tax=Pseudomaricurvus hydrocarbonicus TaxID=1470433 RepID=A0A9E5MJN2_9GAMM|nr:methyltransferase [Aestuariicella hydrocarbonica]NHO65394.1 class I SAM-dependent methyltransferase [Aestuariicella hydrocarbonica]